MDKRPNDKPDKTTQEKTNYPFLVLLLGIFIIGCYFIYKDLFKKNTSKRKEPVEVSSTDYLSSNTETHPYTQPNTPYTYKISNIDLNNRRAFNVDVTISRKLQNYELREVARKVKNQINTKTNRGVIFFLLPLMEPGNGAWAKVNFEPEMSVRIIGKSAAAEQRIRAWAKRQKNKNIVGFWIDNTSPGTIVYRILKLKNGKYLMDNTSPDDSTKDPFPITLRKIIKKGQTIYIEVGNPAGQYDVIDKKGNMNCYDNKGYIITYKKVI